MKKAAQDSGSTTLQFLADHLLLDRIFKEAFFFTNSILGEPKNAFQNSGVKCSKWLATLMTVSETIQLLQDYNRFYRPLSYYDFTHGLRELLTIIIKFKENMDEL